MSRRMVFGHYDLAVFIGYIAYAAVSVVVPVVLVALAADLRFPLDAGGMSAGGSLQAARSVAIVFSMVACGFVAGRWGKRRPLGVSLLIIAAGIMLAAFSPTFAVLLLALIVAGLGEGVIEALATPVIQDLHPEQPGRYINFSHAFWSVGVLGAVLSAGWLLSAGVSWRWVLFGAGALALVPAVLFLSPNRGAAAFLDVGAAVSWREVVGQAAQIARRRRFWLFLAAMFFAGGGEFCLTFWVASFIQLDFARQAWAGGAGTACFAGGMILGRIGWGYLLRQHHLFGLIACSALGGAVVCLPLPWLSSMSWLFVLLVLAGVAVGPFWPSLQSYCVDRIPRVDTTMLLILLACAGVPGCGFFALLMGLIGDVWGLRASFFLVPVCMLFIVALVSIDRLCGLPAETPTISGSRRP